MLLHVGLSVPPGPDTGVADFASVPGAGRKYVPYGARVAKHSLIGMSGRPTALENVPQLLVCGPVGPASPIDLVRPACERAVGICCVA